MLNVATVSDKPPGVEARAATGGTLLLAMATLEPLGAEPLGRRSAAALDPAKPQRQYLQP